MKILAGLLLALVLISGQIARASTDPSPSSSETLYKQLGGYDALAAVTDDFIHRLATDPKLTKFFAGVSDAHKARIRQMFLDFICEKTGGPCVYVGEDMKKVHTGLNITDADWDAAVADLGQTFDKFHVSPELRQKFGDLLGKVKPEVVIPGK
jgi:hemoglobin